MMVDCENLLEGMLPLRLGEVSRKGSYLKWVPRSLEE